MLIKVLGTGCANCKKLEATVQDVVAELAVDAQVEKVTDIRQIMAFGVMSTPGLVIDGETVCSGRVPTKTEINAWVINALATAAD